MKKYLFSLLFMAMAIVSSVALVSCDSKDPVTEEPEKPVAQPHYAKLIVMVSEQIFEYGDFIVTLEYDKHTQTYQLDESTKKADVKFNGMEYWSDKDKIPGRVLEVLPFQYETIPVKYSAKFVFSEEGKKKINAATTEEIDFFVYAKLGKCDKNGKDVYNPDDKTDARAYPGTNVKKLEDFVTKDLVQNYKFLFEQEIK